MTDEREECPACAGLDVAWPGATVMPWDAVRPEACDLRGGEGGVPFDVAVEWESQEVYDE